MAETPLYIYSTVQDGLTGKLGLELEKVYKTFPSCQVRLGYRQAHNTVGCTYLTRSPQLKSGCSIRVYIENVNRATTSEKR